MQEVELARRTEEEETSAKALFDTGAMEATGLVDLMRRVNKPGELPMYYGGGLRLIKEVLRNGMCVFNELTGCSSIIVSVLLVYNYIYALA